MIKYEIQVVMSTAGKFQQETESAVGCFNMVGFNRSVVYDVVALREYKYDDGTSHPVYLIHDENGQMRQTAIEFWLKYDPPGGIK